MAAFAHESGVPLEVESETKPKTNLLDFTLGTAMP